MQINISNFTPFAKKQLARLLEAGSVTEANGEYFFCTRGDVYHEVPKSLEELLEFVIWNTAVLAYSHGKKELINANY